MILIALVLGLQTPPPADMPAAVRALRNWCAQAESSVETWETGDGHHVQLRRGGLECGLYVQPWRGDDGALAAAVRDALAPEDGGWYPVRRRDLVVNESGPMRWSEYEHEIAGGIRLIEPAEGQTGTLTLDLLSGD